MVWVGAVIALLVLCSPSHAQTAKKGRVPFEGSHAFRHLINLVKLRPVSKIADLADLSPRETLLIIFGDNRPLDAVIEATGGLRQFRERGGAILIASDRADDGRLSDLNLEISGSTIYVVAPLGRPPEVPESDAPAAYRGLEDCPFVSRVTHAQHPVFLGCARGIATNQPASIRRLGRDESRSDLLVLAGFPAICTTQFSMLLGGPTFLLGTGSSSGPGERVLVLGGHGVFMNGMMGQRDNDNFRFAANCLRWLSDGPDGRRKHVLFIEEGKVVTDFNVPLVEFPLPTARVVNELLHGLERENFFNRLLLENVPKDRILRYLLVIVSAALAAYALTRLMRSRHRIEPALPRIASKLNRQGSAPPLQTQRQRAHLETGNFWEAARDLARHGFEFAGSRSTQAPLVVRGGRQQRASLQRQVQTLWQLAYIQPPGLISIAELAQLVAMIESVQAAFADGTLAYREPARKVIAQPTPV